MLQPRRSAAPRASVRVRAALAGGLVLGLGAGLTVASWTDAELVHGTFTASSFDLESNLQGAAYTSAGTVTAAVTGVYPGSPAYISLTVRTAAGSTAGTVSLSAAASTTGLAAVLRYRIVATSSACTAAAFSGTPAFVVGSGGATPTYQQVSAALPTTAGLPVGANGTSSAGFCIELGLPASGVPQTYAGASGGPSWSITGTSS